MPLDFRLVRGIPVSDLFDGRLEAFGIRQHPSPETIEYAKCLTDGHSYLWVDVNYDGIVDHLTRYAPNGDPTQILSAISKVFDVTFVSEYEPQYWGYDSEEEWHAALRKLDLNQERFRAEWRPITLYVKYVESLRKAAGIGPEVTADHSVEAIVGWEGPTVQVTQKYLSELRQAAGLRIDPETAEVKWRYAQAVDPYDDYASIPDECSQVGREYFARVPGSYVWIDFGDLPRETRDVLRAKHSSKLSFPAYWLDTVASPH